MEKLNNQMLIELRKLQDEIINLELQNRNMKGNINKITTILIKCGYTENTINDIINREEVTDVTAKSGSIDSLK